MNRMRSLFRAAASIPVALAILALAACGGRDELGTAKGAPLIVISIDTLRSDRLPAYGSKRIETPAIDGLAGEGIVYERAYSHIPLTLPSHTSLLTGQLPVHHGVRDNIGYHFDAAKHPFLPRLLKAAGYATGAAVSSFVLRGETGLGDGFDFYEAGIELRTGEALGRSQRPGGETAALALDWVGKQSDRPFFLMLHLYEPHTPYEPVEPFRSRYSDPYDGEVATADSIVGKFLDGLKERGIYDRAVVILLSDHGEGLGDHGEQEHGILLYREALQVPLIVKLPKGRSGGRRVASPVGLFDVAPTILTLAGIDVPKEIDGLPLPVAEPDAAEAQSRSSRPIYAETFYPRLHLGWSDLTSLIRDRFHLIDGPSPELFDLVGDPGEKADVLRTERRAYAEMRGALEKLKTPLAKPSEADPEAARQLAALGYLGGTSITDLDAALPDPRSRVASLAEFGEAMQAVAEQRFAEAVPKLTRLVAENPKMVDAWVGLGTALSRVGRLKDALAAYEKAMEVSGGSPQVALGTAKILLLMGRLDEAAKHAELGVKSSPVAARSLMAEIAEARGDLGAAEEQARKALAEGGSQAGPLVTLAQIQQKRGKAAEALATADKALAALARSGADHEGLQSLRGDLLARLGRSDEAEKAFLDEIQKFSGSLTTYSRLATLYASEGKAQEAVAMLRRMTETNKSPAAYGQAVQTLRVLGDRQSAAALLRYAQSLFPGSLELRKLAG
ncbi:MAG TPA: sulfatase-like hydrolase/transferase [Thermoanaerobaculia bacterium]|jgi:arylsulfatase A-like enzyme/Tfp pilus assembly protein PilF|nr:sulfatase-like hydrolase/transferase [Thermoanaerobaculia bacterium]